MRNIIEIVNEAKTKGFNINGENVILGQQIKLKVYRNFKETDETRVVSFAGPYDASDSKFKAIDGEGKSIIVNKDAVVEILPFNATSEKKTKKITREAANKLYAEISQYEAQIRDLMAEQEEYGAEAIAKFPDIDAADAPVKYKPFNDCWKEINKIANKLGKIRTKLVEAGY